MDLFVNTNVSGVTWLSSVQNRVMEQAVNRDCLVDEALVGHVGDESFEIRAVRGEARGPGVGAEGRTLGLELVASEQQQGIAGIVVEGLCFRLRLLPPRRRRGQLSATTTTRPRIRDDPVPV